jgi:hypothetical protein
MDGHEQHTPTREGKKKKKRGFTLCSIPSPTRDRRMVIVVFASADTIQVAEPLDLVSLQGVLGAF